MAKEFSDEQLKALLAGIADGLPIGALAGRAGISAPTFTNRINRPGFMSRIANAVPKYDADAAALLARLEAWWKRDGEREAAYQLRQRVAKAIRARFAAEDKAEQEAAKRKGKTLLRGGIYWTWSQSFGRWECGGSNYWRGSIGGDV
jgi:hypothetical protein